MTDKILITSYKNPDVDGVACAYAYAEFLQKKGVNVQAGLFGTPHPEAQFVLKKFNISQPINIGASINNYNKIILVDMSHPEQYIPKEKVIEIIDHRKTSRFKEFPNAKSQIELVGSCATLIAEKFYKDKIEPTKESAILLYSAIVSNTVNFQGKVTTQRDKDMAEWLKTKVDISENYVYDMFVHKSDLSKSIHDILFPDFKEFRYGNKIVGIAQLEIVNVDEFIKQKKEQAIEWMDKIKQEMNLDFVFLTCIDLEKAYNVLLISNEESKQLLITILGLSFDNGISKTDHILMRKEIVPKLKAFLESQN